MRLLRLSCLATAGVALIWVAALVADHGVAVALGRGMLPRWDLATHLLHGWTDYHYLVTGQWHRLVWDLWQQAYWPPMHSVWQMPFYLVAGGTRAAGSWSSLGAFVALGLVGVLLLWHELRDAALLPAAAFVALLSTSPFILAYASVAMTELPGALAQVTVLYAWARYLKTPSADTARLVAITLTILFFTKYNYFLLLVAPLLIHLGLNAGAARTLAAARSALTESRRILSRPLFVFFTVYGVALVIVLLTGGFEFSLFGQQVSVRSIGSSGHVVLYLVLARLWYARKRGLFDWRALVSGDQRVAAFVRWFVLPLLVWFVVPYPNHIRDFANLVVNRPLGTVTVASGLEVYGDALRRLYLPSDLLLAAVLAVALVAAARYRHHASLMRLLIVAVPVQFAMVALHHTRFPRFLLLSVVLLFLLAAAEVGHWIQASRGSRLVAGLMAPVVLVLALMVSARTVDSPAFSRLAFAEYTTDGDLRAAIEELTVRLAGGGQLAVMGESDALSPAMLRWELGPPSGLPSMPIGGSLELADWLLLVVPTDPQRSAASILERHAEHRAAVDDALSRKALEVEGTWPIPEFGVSLVLYRIVR